MSDEIFISINNFKNNYNDNNILTSNESSESRNNNIEIDTKTIIAIDLKINNNATSNYANTNCGNLNLENNWFHDNPPDDSVKPQMNMEVIWWSCEEMFLL